MHSAEKLENGSQLSAARIVTRLPVFVFIEGLTLWNELGNWKSGAILLCLKLYGGGGILEYLHNIIPKQVEQYIQIHV